MEQVKEILALLGEQMKKLAQANAVVAKPISAGDRHVLPLCELSFGFGAGGGTGEAAKEAESQDNQGSGAGAGGNAKATPVAALIVDGSEVRLESFGK